MSTNEYSKRREIKELIKAEIKGSIKEFGPLSTLQGIVSGVLGKVTDKKINVIRKKYDREIAKAKAKEKAATDDMLAFAKKLEKQYKTWDKVPFNIKNRIDKLIPDVAQLLKDL